MNQPLKLGIAGLGTVGTGLLQLLGTSTAPGWRAMLGRSIEVVGVSARSRTKKRGSRARRHRLVRRAGAAGRRSVDRRVRRADRRRGRCRQGRGRGGARRPASTSSPPTRRCSPSTASSWRELAEKNGVALNFEAAVAGGIPVIKTLREALAGNQIRRVYGILNGTCNYILTQMQEEHRAFADVLKEAQAKGYAEADPTFDIGGFDTAHKLALLTSLAFGTQRCASTRSTSRASSRITEADIEAADDLGYRIKLLGVALMTESGIEQRVHPAMVPQAFGHRRSFGRHQLRRHRRRFCRQPAARRSRRRRQADGLRGRWRHPRHRARRHRCRRSACRPPSSSRTSAPSSASTRAPTMCASSVLRPARRHGRHRRAHGRARRLAREHRAASPARRAARHRRAAQARRADRR